MKAWYRTIFYHGKAALKHRSVWAVLGVCLFLFFVWKGISLPSIDNTEVGICTGGSARAEKVLASLRSSEDGIFRFTEYATEDALTEDVLSGKLECAFVFESGFDALVKKDQLKKSIRYIRSPYTTKGEVAKEALYRAFLKDQSADILAENAERIFEFSDEAEKENILDEICRKNEYYIESNEIFTVSFQ